LAPIIEGRADITLVRASAAKATPVRYRCTNLRQSPRRRLDQLLYGVKISDLGSFRAGRADVAALLALEEATYGWAWK